MEDETQKSHEEEIHTYLYTCIDYLQMNYNHFDLSHFEQHINRRSLQLFAKSMAY